MTLNCYKFFFSENFAGFRRFWQATTAKGVSVSSGTALNPLNLPFKIMFLALICRRFLGASYTHSRSHALLSRAYLSVS